MKKYYCLLIFITLVLLSCTPNREDHVIYSDGIGKIKLGDPYNKIANYFKSMHYTVEVNNSKKDNSNKGLFVYENGKVILQINNKNYEEPPLIAKMIYVHSPDFKTEDGLYVGMPLKEIVKKHYKLEVIADEEDEGYHLLIESLQEKSFFEKDTIVFLIDIEFKSLINNDMEYINSHLNNMDGNIVGFSIFYFN
jgi:hypothetical protein